MAKISKVKAKRTINYRPNAIINRYRRNTYYDYSLLAVIILLVCFGLIMLYSTSSYTAQVSFGDDMYYFRRQGLISLACMVIMIAISYIDYHLLQAAVYPLYAIAIVLMLLVKSPLGLEANGARRWLQIGPINFQPAEIAKIAVIIAMAFAICKMGRKVTSRDGILQLIAIGAIPALIAYVFTDNLSTAIIIFAITAGLIFMSHPKTAPFLIAFAAVIIAAVIFVWILSSALDTSSSFRIRRILVWLHPEDYADGDGYQTLQALYAIGSGGLFGRGLGNSIQKLGSVPEAQNDMIFSIVCEELGIVGGMILLLLFLYLLYRLFFIAQNAPDLFGSLLVTGIFIHIALQVILNVAVVLALLPNTGVTLPFVSYGGTSILFLMAEMGIALGVARRIRFEEPDIIV